jgi:hypothetical protein
MFGSGQERRFSRDPRRVRSTSNFGKIAAAQRIDVQGQLHEEIDFTVFVFISSAADRSSATSTGNPTQRLVGVQVKIELDLQVCDPSQKLRRKTKSAIS